MDINITIKNQTLIRTDTNRVVADSQNYLNVRFAFSNEWDAYPVKTAVFRYNDTPYTVPFEGDAVTVPAVAIKYPGFNVSVFAGELITANSLYIQVQESGYAPDGEPIPDVEPNLYNTLIDKFTDALTQTRSDAETSGAGAERAEAAADNSRIYADNSRTSANDASVIKDDTAALKAVTEQNKTATAEYKQQAMTAKEQAEYWAKYSERYALNQPTHYYKNSTEEMQTIENPKQGDLCYVIAGKARTPTEQYVYDTVDMDGDGVNPEWLFIGYLTDLKEISWGDVVNKPFFADIAMSGSYNDLGDRPNRYEQFIAVTNGVWDYAVTDKIILQQTDLTVINNVTNGAIGMILSTMDITLPDNSKKSLDFDYVTVLQGQHYMYTFIYDGVYYHWTRTVCG